MFSIRSRHELYKNSTDTLQEIKTHLLRLLPFWVAGALTAVFATSYAFLFEYVQNMSLQLFEYLG